MFAIFTATLLIAPTLLHCCPKHLGNYKETMNLWDVFKDFQ